MFIKATGRHYRTRRLAYGLAWRQNGLIGPRLLSRSYSDAAHGRVEHAPPKVRW